MTPLRRFGTSIAPLFMAGACAQIIGLSDFEKGDAVVGEGGQGTSGDSSGGHSGSSVKGGDGGAGDNSGGTAGVLSTGGRPGRGGTSGDGGAAGEPGGDTGLGGTDATGGTGNGGTSGKGGAAGANQGGTGGTPGTGGNGGMGGAGGSPPCIEVTAMALADLQIDRSADPHLVAYAFEISPGLGLTSNPDYLEVQFWNGGSFDGILTGMFPLGTGREANNSTCSRCLFGFQDPDASASLRKIFFQTSGTLTMGAGSQQMDGFPDFSYSNVTLREVTIDPLDGHSTVVPGGQCLHFASGSFTLPPEWNCDPTWQGDGECDCGCGVPDDPGDCATGSVDECLYCWCGDLSANCDGFIGPTKNWTCL